MINSSTENPLCPPGKHSDRCGGCCCRSTGPFFYIHVDQDSGYMLHQLASLAALPNIVFSKLRYAAHSHQH